MNPRSALVLGVCLVLCCLILGACFGQPLAAQAPARQDGSSSGSGRYHLVVAGTDPGTMIVIDTQTGHCWGRQIQKGEKWLDVGTPTEAKDNG